MKKSKPTILIVDDTKINIDILLELLSDEYDLIVALDGKSAIQTVQEDSVDLILLDIMMPDMDGYEVCKIIKADESAKDMPIIFITAKTDEMSIEKAYEVGGIDYITKPFKARELAARIRIHLKLKFLIEELETLASYDPMTGIYNRRKFFEVAKKRFAAGSDDLYAVIMDIDNFKLVNDTYGHSVGDTVIQSIVHTIDGFCDDFVFGRLGGEEFAILCSFESFDETLNYLENIRKAVSNLKIVTDTGETICCSISLGFSKKKKDTKSLDLLLKEADIALYKAKGSGRDKTIFFQDE